MRSDVHQDRSDAFIWALVDLLRARRQQLGISQIELSERLGVTESLVARWETRDKRPTSDNLWCWCHALGVRLTAEAE